MQHISQMSGVNVRVKTLYAQRNIAHIPIYRITLRHSRSFDTSQSFCRLAKMNDDNRYSTESLTEQFSNARHIRNAIM